MNRFHGKVGYGETIEVLPGTSTPSPGSGVWDDVITERAYTGDVVRSSALIQQGDAVNPDISMSVSISILTDDHIIAHYSKIKYVEWAGELWTVTNVEPKSPRLILSLGSVYNGPRPT
jgi:hypothetical protein